MSIIDHTGLTVRDMARSKRFYEQTLAPLGITLAQDFGPAAGFGRGPKPDFWIAAGPASFQTPEHVAIITPQHLAFVARTRAEVDAFHVAGLAAGGKDFGPPGPRPHYHANYYGAFILDPDGHNIEAVFHGPA